MCTPKKKLDRERILLIAGIVFTVVALLYSGYVYYYNNYVWKNESNKFNFVVDWEEDYFNNNSILLNQSQTSPQSYYINSLHNLTYRLGE